MGVLENILAKADNARRVASRNTSDFITSPADFLGMVTGRLAEQNARLASGSDESINALLGIMLGRGAKLPGLEARMSAAETSLAKGSAPKEVFKETGIFTSPGDKKLRAEISDLSAKLTSDVSKQKTSLRLDEILTHPELFEAYPQLRALPVRTDPATINSQYNSLPEIVLGVASRNAADHRKALLHEVQHAVQGIEGFATGTSQRPVLTNSSNAYRRSAGEAEARAVEARADLPEALRKVLYPGDSYDVPAKLLIVD